ncbi:hypothetical protein NM208_g7044 [Fusarium decemcellulare]|uniref:Uncharacterized protein n=1 Tax=Fusarium decemcellulare TaxID=57161 RepID=A0ACC1SAW9_9HYPO|nr:hypothetical protein NM208_g7044 [Fusarium decemcellulare]
MKCDKARPACLRCRTAGKECDGFQTKLNWVKGGRESSNKAIRKMPRKCLYTDQMRSSMSLALQLNTTTESVQDSISALDNRFQDCGTADDDAAVVGPFGVFKIQQSICNEATARHVEQGPMQAFDELFPDSGDLLDWQDLFHIDLHPNGLPSTAYDEALTSLPSIQHDFSMGVPSIISLLTDRPSWEGPNESVGDCPSEIAGDISIPPHPSTTYLDRDDAQLLLKHVKSHCFPHMWSLPLGSRSPLDIHLNGAAMTLASFTYLDAQHISHASFTNLLAILALSAKHLAAHTLNPETRKRWDDFAEAKFREAQKHLDYSLCKEISPKTAKYKDLVMAASSALSFAILHSRQSEARTYLVDIEMLLQTCGLAKPRISRKARLLHHTYTWNRIVGESTYVLRDHERNGEEQPWRPSKGWSGRHHKRRTVPNLKLDDFLHLEPPPLETEAAEGCERLHDIHLTRHQGKSESTFMMLYGISETWLSLLSQTTRLANQMEALKAGAESRDVQLVEYLERRKELLEHKICSFASKSPAAQQDSSLARNHLVQALNFALVIFFYRRIHNVSPYILQDYVQRIIRALKDFPTCCESGACEGPGSPWPAFMAGCEALDTEQRNFFSDWFDRAFAKTGFERLVTAKGCMVEVWKRRDRFLEDGRDWTWVHVSKDQGLYVLLS